MQNIISFEGKFRIWAYTISHSCILIRRTIDEKYKTRIDILFKPVSWFCLPTDFTNIKINEVNESKIKDIKIDLKKYRNNKEKIFKIEGENTIGYIISNIVAFHEDEKSYSEDSYFEDFKNEV